MKNFFTWVFIIIAMVAVVFISSPSVRKWWCGIMNKRFKSEGDNCSNCETGIEGVITKSGECIPRDIVNYEACTDQNSQLRDGQECVGCGSDPNIQTSEGFSGKGVIVSGACMPVPDAFAGKICVPSNAAVRPSALSYKRILSGETYRYFKNNGSVVSQREGSLDEEITMDEYIHAYVQAVKPCPAGQIKV